MYKLVFSLHKGYHSPEAEKDSSFDFEANRPPIQAREFGMLLQTFLVGLDMGGLRLCKSEIYFRVQPEREPSPLNLTLYMPTHALTDLGKSMSFILLVKTIGEEFVVTRIGPIDWQDVASKSEDAKPRVELYEGIAQL